MSGKFPAVVYARTVLSANFADAQRYFLDPLLELSAAHAIMLAQRGIITTAEARAGVEALQSLGTGEKRAQLDAAVFDGSVEDLFFYVEQRMIAAVGLDTAGKLHTARSRNDIDLTEYRMVLRREVMACAGGVQRLAVALMKLAREYATALMPALTHTQPAQPTTLGHYLAAAIECFVRDGGRLQAVFATVNLNPLGACAITTTGFPIDREITAELLGFEGLQLNSYGAIAAIDYLTATAGAVAVAMVNVGKLVQDLLQWCTVEVGYLRLGDAWVQTSSIMPQKRNPVALEHTRILASKALAQAQGVFTCAHNTPFGDIVDSEDDLQPLALGMTTDTRRALDLFAGLLGDCTFDTAKMRTRAHENFLTVTELADTLARRGGVGFRVAHHLVSEAVKASADGSELLENVRRLAPEITGEPLKLPEAAVREALDPEHFVAIRNIPGGPAAEALGTALDQYGAELLRQQGWIESKQRLLDAYPGRIREAAKEL